jgi:penicillin-binding protein 1B
LRAIRTVLTAKGILLQRYELSVERKFEPGPIYLINHALQRTVSDGTGQALMNTIPAKYHLAGKTGTTDELRDSWFAGFSANYVAVVWVGRDDNQAAGLTGASGALRIWANILAGLNVQALDLSMPGNVAEKWVDEQTNELADAGCKRAIRTPFINGSAPTKHSSCGGGVKTWINRVFD